jgi:hypothetical protein
VNVEIRSATAESKREVRWSENVSRDVNRTAPKNPKPVHTAIRSIRVSRRYDVLVEAAVNVERPDLSRRGL